MGTLQSLNILDTLPEERFDRLTRMAKRMFRVPIALVSLVDENRQWFKSCVGVDVSETPRDISFCGHSILGDDVFIISDTLKDTRFVDNPLVTEAPHIRFYAGCPLQVNNHKLGTLCIIDQSPRVFDQDDTEALQDLAAMVERELEAVQLATLDELTGITNRRGFIFLAQHTLNLCTRSQFPATLVFLDLNKFKYINDAFGHTEGDAALTAFTALLKNIFRDSDVFARIGGDEFIVLLSNSSQAQAEAILERLELALQAHNRENQRDYDISFSCGVVEYNPERHASIRDLMAAGDRLMYEKKKADEA